MRIWAECPAHAIQNPKLYMLGPLTSPFVDSICARLIQERPCAQVTGGDLTLPCQYKVLCKRKLQLVPASLSSASFRNKENASKAPPGGSPETYLSMERAAHYM